MTLLQYVRPRVAEAVLASIRACRHAGDSVGAIAFPDQMAQKYLAAGTDFVNIGADVSILARNTEELAAKYIASSATAPVFSATVRGALGSSG